MAPTSNYRFRSDLVLSRSVIDTDLNKASLLGHQRDRITGESYHTRTYNYGCLATKTLSSRVNRLLEERFPPEEVL